MFEPSDWYIGTVLECLYDCHQCTKQALTLPASSFRLARSQFVGYYEGSACDRLFRLQQKYWKVWIACALIKEVSESSSFSRTLFTHLHFPLRPCASHCAGEEVFGWFGVMFWVWPWITVMDPTQRQTSSIAVSCCILDVSRFSSSQIWMRPKVLSTIDTLGCVGLHWVKFTGTDVEHHENSSQLWHTKYELMFIQTVCIPRTDRVS